MFVYVIILCFFSNMFTYINRANEEKVTCCFSQSSICRIISSLVDSDNAARRLPASPPSSAMYAPVISVIFKYVSSKLMRIFEYFL